MVASLHSTVGGTKRINQFGRSIFAESASDSKIFDKSKMKWPEALFQRLVWEVHRQESGGTGGEGGAGQRIQHWRPPAALTCPAY